MRRSTMRSAPGSRGAPDVLALALCERSLVADGTQPVGPGRGLATQAHSVLHQAGIQDSYVTPLVCAVQARAALHRGDVPAARRELISALRLRPLLTYAYPHWAVQLRIELTRVHLALADLAGARTLMREIDEILKRRPDLGTLAGEAQDAPRPARRGARATAPGASALTAAELRLLPMLSTHLRCARSPARCSCRRTPSRRRASRSTGNWAPPAAARR